MKNVKICDSTVRKLSMNRDLTLSFKEKLEVAKLLDRLNVDVIELDEIKNKKVDSLLIKSVVTAVHNSLIAVSVPLGEDPALTAAALSEAPRFRLQIVAPGSSVRMEYVYHKKSTALLPIIVKSVEDCKKYTKDVELIIDDATRGDLNFIKDVIVASIGAGATTITFCDDAGTMLPEEFAAFLEERIADIPELNEVAWGVSCSNELALADGCAIAALCHGASEIKASAYPVNTASLSNVCRVIDGKGDSFNAHTGVSLTSMKRIIAQIERFCTSSSSDRNVFNASGEDTDTASLNKYDTKEAVLEAAEKLGYMLTEEDAVKVFEKFKRLASKKGNVSGRELDAIIAAEAMQVPAAYTLDSYIANTGNFITSMVHVKLSAGNNTQEGISLGDGPIDAAFKAIEQITGRHFELDDFQIQAITEGKEAAGETIVKLRSEGKVYSGRGLSTDIIGASINAYINALNKIIYEEDAEQ